MQTKELKNYQTSLHTYRYFIGRHYKLLEELKSEYYEKYDDYTKKHKIDSKKELYNKLDANIEHLIDQLTNQRQHEIEINIQSIFIALGVIGIVSVLAAILALLPDADEVCGSSIKNSGVWKGLYEFLISYPIIILGFFGLSLIGVVLYNKYRKKY